MHTNGVGHIIRLTMHCTPYARSQWGDRCVYHELKSKGNNHKECSGDFRKGRQSSEGVCFCTVSVSCMHEDVRARDKMDIEPRSAQPGGLNGREGRQITGQ
jgi:hypothetical protein